ncbi:hypothetical protein [Hymenobacter weizhouensis]|uniref:hypothetical protein n=1 Tax=Hymenobacter sp. YIM 151500-1 TaxID=2987689 RepID=UPI00222705AF|nr:hypothetical protein [Hymenobacter sp. YIM 151500-1]UYZ63693.1 hypothetical protein OIS53_02340 [Hymenobacter sp. YIM 151500-1]
MDTPLPSPDINPGQLVRYVVQIDAMQDTNSIGQVRQVLMSLGLLVDRIEAGEAEVAVLQAPGPGPEGIRQALHAAGFAVQDITAQPG